MASVSARPSAVTNSIAAPSADAGEHAAASAQERVWYMLAALPERERSLLVMRLIENRSLEETARRLGTSEADALEIQFQALRHAGEIEATHAVRNEATDDVNPD
jgi:DNA-directed RNA polymerase specialized sigma24 family protein